MIYTSSIVVVIDIEIHLNNVAHPNLIHIVYNVFVME